METSDILIQKIQSIAENTLTQDIIIPLLKTLGYYKVEFNGGSNEDGKDIIMWDKDRFEETTVHVAQVKHFKLSNKASGNDSIQTVVNQLENCTKKQILNTDKIAYFPSKTILISSYPIPTITLKTRFSEHQVLKDHNIQIIDGVKLCELLRAKCPELVQNILGLDHNISTKIEPTLNNEILLKALGYNSRVSIKNIYTDINFNLGKHTPRILLKMDFNPQIYKDKITHEEWQDFKEMCKSLSSTYEINFINPPIDQVDKSVDLSILNKWKKQIKDLEKEKEILEYQFEENKKTHFNKKKELKKLELKYSKEGIDDNFTINSLKNELRKTESALDFEQKDLALIKRELEKAIKPVVVYTIKIDGHLLAKQILEKRNLLINNIKAINKNDDINISDLKLFIKDSKELIHTTESLFKNSLIISSLRSLEVEFKSATQIGTLSIDVQKIFETGLNLLVMGEAGAGKTTSLQMFAYNQIHNQAKKTIWISLSRMIQFINEDKKVSNTVPLITCINIYLNRLGILNDENSILSLFKSNPITLMLDGLDEVIKPAPWLAKEIKRFSIEHSSNVQIIVSSRLSTKNISELDFFSITLMPFTNKQRDHFIKQWFSECQDGIYYNRVTKHLKENHEVAEIVKNPLLSTTLCVLAESNLPLPRTEINLYNDRITLLTGYYDNVKNIDSRITITPKNLETLATKIAYYLHSNDIREDDLDNLINFATKAMGNHLSRENAEIGVHELIDPCNILVPMSKDGQFGFGHLRYQEHLAAKVIQNNRGVKIPLLIKNPWWKGVFIIFSKLNDDIEWLIKDLGKESLVKRNQEILFEMIHARPKHEQENLESLVNNYILAETGDL
jgi:hypothetical protein